MLQYCRLVLIYCILPIIGAQTILSSFWYPWTFPRCICNPAEQPVSLLWPFAHLLVFTHEITQEHLKRFSNQIWYWKILWKIGQPFKFSFRLDNMNDLSIWTTMCISAHTSRITCYIFIGMKKLLNRRETWKTHFTVSMRIFPNTKYLGLSFFFTLIIHVSLFIRIDNHEYTLHIKNSIYDLMKWTLLSK
jgi:hypothetical protein